MSTLTAGEARSRISSYSSKIETAAHKFQRNFDDMDLENANRRNEMEDIIEQMIRDCNSVKEEMKGLSFES